MRLLTISLRGVTRFTGPQPATIDFDALGPGLIAVVGPNGAGKTTTLESAAVALYKAFPSRPSFYENFSGRDAFIEAAFVDAGHELKVRLAVDADRRTTEGYIFLDGASLTTGRAAEFEAEVERRFGSYALFLSSVFAAQDKSGNFLTMKKVDRKSLFVELLGLGALEVLHEAARQHAAAAESELALARSKVATVEAEVEDLLAVEVGLGEAQGAADRAAHQLEAARIEEAAALAALERAKGAAERLAALASAETAAQRELTAAEKVLAEARALAGKADVHAKERLKFLDVRKVEELEPRAAERHRQAMERLSGRRASLESALRDAPEEAAVRADLIELEKERDALDASERRAERARADHQLAAAELKSAESRLAAVAKAREDEIARLEKQAALMPKVPCTVRDRWPDEPDSPGDLKYPDLVRSCPLLADARSARERIALLGAGPSNEEEVAETTLRAAKMRASATAEEATLAEVNAPGRLQKRDLLKRRAGTLSWALARAQGATSAREHLKLLAQEVDVELKQHALELEDAREKLAGAAEERARIEAERGEAMFVAGEKVAEAEKVRLDAYAHHLLAFDALQAEQESGDGYVEAEKDAREWRRTREEREAALRTADQYLARVRAQVDALQAKAATLPALRDAVTAAEGELGDWSLLARALGKDGVQALEIDAAGPEVAHLTNELLESCYGPRFSISFETLREKKSAKGEYAEAFDVKVYDGGAERTVEALSGGEKVVVGEAVGLAISIFNARKSGIRWETLWRDETAGALDPDNAQAYVLMLRRARELGGFHQVIFVSHQPEVWEAADVRLLVANGSVMVEGEKIAA